MCIRMGGTSDGMVLDFRLQTTVTRPREGHKIQGGGSSHGRDPLHGAG